MVLTKLVRAEGRGCGEVAACSTRKIALLSYFSWSIPFGPVINGLSNIHAPCLTFSLNVYTTISMEITTQLQLQASYDTILILTSILMFGLPAVYTYTQQDFFAYYFFKIFPYITRVVYPVGMISQTGSVYLTLCVSVERYVAVCLPLKARDKSNKAFWQNLQL